MSVKRSAPSDPTGDPSDPSAPLPTRRARNPHGQGGRLRAELVAAADRILAATGDVETLSLRGVAREVGIATPSIYLHFSDKGTLVHAVLAERFAQLAAAVTAAANSADGPAAQLRAGCLAYCRFATEHPNAYRVLFGRLPAARPNPPAPDAGPHPPTPSPARRGGDRPLVLPLSAPERGLGGRGDGGPPWRDVEVSPVSLPVGAEAFGFLVGGVQRCMQAGLAPTADPMRTAVGVWTALHGIVSLRGSVPLFPWPPLEQQIDAVLQGLVGLRDARHNEVTERKPVSE